jgi:hypothetical protein
MEGRKSFVGGPLKIRPGLSLEAFQGETSCQTPRRRLPYPHIILSLVFVPAFPGEKVGALGAEIHHLHIFRILKKRLR